METKKMLVYQDRAKPMSMTKDFLAVIFQEGTPVFLGLHSKKIRKTGRVILLDSEDVLSRLFCRLIETGHKIESVEKTRQVLSAYVEQISNFKLGNLLEVIPDADGIGFRLIKISDFPKRKVINLP